MYLFAEAFTRVPEVLPQVIRILTVSVDTEDDVRVFQGQLLNVRLVAVPLRID